MESTMTRWGVLLACGVALWAASVGARQAPAYRSNISPAHPAIAWSTAPVRDPMAKLLEQLQRSGEQLQRQEGPLGFLPDLLARTGLRDESQMVVFSKTSFQADVISPKNPRAIYFGDDFTVAYVPGGRSLEIAAVDPTLGPVFYTLTADANGKAVVSRGRDVCLRCHQGPNTEGVPGIYVGSVVPGPTGAPLRNQSAIITDHRSPFDERWGGWFVTARSGEPESRANAVAFDPADPGTLVRNGPPNLASLRGRFDLNAYVAPTSDLVALMVFEHQTLVTNLTTRVGWQARIAEHDGTPISAPLRADIEALVAALLFSGEAPLTEPIRGSSTFAETFVARGPRDAKGRSLREFDLETRLFRHPLSFLVYSEQFKALPASVLDLIASRLHDVLSGRDRSTAFTHLSSADHQAILEIIRETHPRLATKRG